MGQARMQGLRGPCSMTAAEEIQAVRTRMIDELCHYAVMFGWGLIVSRVGHAGILGHVRRGTWGHVTTDKLCSD